MNNLKRQYIILAIPFIGFAIITILIMINYYKYFDMLKAWAFIILTIFGYYVLSVTIGGVLFTNYLNSDEALFEAMAIYVMLLFAGVLMITTQRYILKKHGFEL